MTKAAARIGIAISHNLTRLRTRFGDELPTRTSKGMQLTPRARMLHEPLKIALANVAQLISRPDSFEPAKSARVFHIGLPDSVGWTEWARILQATNVFPIDPYGLSARPPEHIRSHKGPGVRGDQPPRPDRKSRRQNAL